MKLLLAFLAGAALAFAALADPPSLPATLRTLDGKEFTGVTLRSVTPDAVQIVHDAGTASITFANLPEELRAPLGYDAAKAADFSNRTAQARAETAARASAAAAEAANKKSLAASAVIATVQVEQVLPDGALVAICREIGGSSSGLSRVGGGGLTGPPSYVASSKVVFLKGLKDVTDAAKVRVRYSRDGFWKQDGRTLEQWVFIEKITPAK